MKVLARGWQLVAIIVLALAVAIFAVHLAGNMVSRQLPKSVDPKYYLNVLSFVSVAIGLASGMMTQLFVTADTVNGKKVLTPAGWVALGVSLVAFAGTFSSELLKQYVANKQLQQKEIDDAVKARLAEQDRQWKSRSETLSTNILNNTRSELDKSQERFNTTLEQFKTNQTGILATYKEAALSYRKVLAPASHLKMKAQFAIDCTSETFAYFCSTLTSIRDKHAGEPKEADFISLFDEFPDDKDALDTAWPIHFSFEKPGMQLLDFCFVKKDVKIIDGKVDEFNCDIAVSSYLSFEKGANSIVVPNAYFGGEPIVQFPKAGDLLEVFYDGEFIEDVFPKYPSLYDFLDFNLIILERNNQLNNTSLVYIEIYGSNYYMEFPVSSCEKVLLRQDLPMGTIAPADQNPAYTVAYFCRNSNIAFS